jgi:CHASE2 domain-containing sensor protein
LDFSFIDSLKSVDDEVEMKDIYFSRIQNKDEIVENNIVLIDIDTCKRAQMIDLFKKIQEYKPKVVGVDVLFKDDETDGNLIRAYTNYSETSSSTVFACVDSGKNISHSFFATNGFMAVEGLANLGSNGYGKPIRQVLNKCKSEPNLMSFSAKVASIYDSSLPSLKKIKADTSFNLTFKPFVFSKEINAVDIINDTSNAFAQFLKNKIVLIGSLDSAEDKHKVPNAGYSDNNELYASVSGLKIHAMAISMLLNDTIINEPSTFWGRFFTVFIFLLYFYIFFYLIEYHEFYYELTSRLVLLISGILMLFLYVLLMKKGIEIDLGYLVIIILLICGMMELYKPVVHLLIKGWKRLVRIIKT